MVTFECETSEPFIKVKWLKNGSEIFSGDKYRMHSDRKVHFLSVLIIDMKDDAEYTCVIADDENLRTSAHLHVEGDCHNFCSSSVFSVLDLTPRVHGSSACAVQVLPWSWLSRWRALRCLRPTPESLRWSCLEKTLKAPGSLETKSWFPATSTSCPPAEVDTVYLSKM